MKLKDFVDIMVELLNKYGCDVCLCSYNYKMNSVEITDTYYSRFRVYTSNLYNYPNNTVALAIECYVSNTMIHIHIEASNLCMIDPLTALLEMNMPRLMIRAMAYQAEQRMFYSLETIVDDIVFSNNEHALNIALNTDYETICRENLFCICSLEQADITYDGNGKIIVHHQLSSAVGLSKKFINKLIIKYPDSTRCIPLLLRYLNEHFVSDEDGGIGL